MWSAKSIPAALRVARCVAFRHYHLGGIRTESYTANAAGEKERLELEENEAPREFRGTAYRSITLVSSRPLMRKKPKDGFCVSKINIDYR